MPLLVYSEESGLGRIMRTLIGAGLNSVGAEVIFTAHLAVVLKTMALEARGIAWLPQSLIKCALMQSAARTTLDSVLQRQIMGSLDQVRVAGR